jgi:hypothetical protein
VQSHAVKHLEEVFPSRTSPTRVGKMGTPSSSSRDGRPTTADYDHRGGGSGGAPSGAVSHYAAQLKSCEMRYTILRNELDDVAAEERQLNVKKTKINKGTEQISQHRCCCQGRLCAEGMRSQRSGLHTRFPYQAMSLTFSALFPLPQLPNTCRTNATS